MEPWAVLPKELIAIGLPFTSSLVLTSLPHTSMSVRVTPLIETIWIGVSVACELIAPDTPRTPRSRPPATRAWTTFASPWRLETSTSSKPPIDL